MGFWQRLVSSDTHIGLRFDRFIYSLIIASLVLFALETLPEAEPYQRWFDWSEWVIVAAFTFEYVLRLIMQGRSYAFSLYGLIDAVAVVPFYVSLGIADLRVVRVLRLARLFRVVKLQRYGSAWRRLRLAMSEIRDELVVFGGLTVVLVYLSSVGIYYFEHDTQPEVFRSIFHSMWWAVCTLTTVGYGDIYPVTVGGRIFTFVILILGLGVVAVPSGLFASALSRQTDRANRTMP